MRLGIIVLLASSFGLTACDRAADNGGIGSPREIRSKLLTADQIRSWPNRYADQKYINIKTNSGFYKVPVIPIFEIYQPADPHNKPNVEFYIKKEDLYESDKPRGREVSSELLQGVRVLVEFLDSPKKVDAFERSSREMKLYSEYISLSGVGGTTLYSTGISCPEGSEELDLSKEISLKWSANGSEFYLGCRGQTYISDRSGVLLSCSGLGTTDVGVMQINSSAHAPSGCREPILKIIQAASQAPSVIDTFK